ncbi:MAG: hypothetical protein FWG98_14745 [Candidatus Cloacimonetes bacterium]|nr:hypothetical protein [Candidatus Cloacimonadota bacterium]
MDTAWQWINNQIGNPPPDLAKSLTTFGTSWVWMVEYPEQKEVFRIRVALNGEHVSIWKIFGGGAPWNGHTYLPWGFISPYFELNPPIRVMD